MLANMLQCTGQCPPPNLPNNEELFGPKPQYFVVEIFFCWNILLQHLSNFVDIKIIKMWSSFLVCSVEERDVNRYNMIWWIAYIKCSDRRVGEKRTVWEGQGQGFPEEMIIVGIWGMFLINLCLTQDYRDFSLIFSSRMI